MSACTAADCDRPARSKGLCGRHYERLRTTGSVELQSRRRMCEVDGCDRPHAAKGMCFLHWGRHARVGSVELPPKPTFEERLWASVEKTQTCWLWQGNCTLAGYGRIGVGDTESLYVHRVVYELLVGPIPDDLTIDHLCRVRHCCNPTHLEPVTRAENTLREMQARKKESA